jgi:hypothetical protein
MVERMSWWKIGLLGIVAIPVAMLLLVWGLAKIDASGRDMQEHVLIRELSQSPAMMSGTVESTAEHGATTTPGTVFIDVTGVELNVAAAPSGGPIRIRAVYDRGREELVETYDPGSGDGWVYRVSLHRVKDSFMGHMSAVFVTGYPKFTVLLPRDTPMALELVLAQGGGAIDLGGLWLTSAAVRLSQGGMGLTVSEPTPQPMERFSFAGSMGGAGLSRIGNASPAIIDVTHKMGGMDLDLRGDWRQDSVISFAVDMGGAGLQLPDNTAIRGLEDKGISFSESSNGAAPILTIATQANNGEIEIRP